MCFKETDILLPKKAHDPDFMKKWAVIACDQHTCDISYWRKARELAEGEMTALNIIFPEAYLETESELEQQKRMENIAECMVRYEKDMECHRDSMFYIERTLKNGSVRRGLVGAVDLEAYDYSQDSKAKIRPTEKTVPERIPPRLKIRRNAILESPHAMILFEDEGNILMSELERGAPALETIYDFELMQGSGAIKCRKLDRENMDYVKQTLKSLEKNGVLFAVGDGNHSLAAAKQCWEEIKKTLSPERHPAHPARYALAEIVNIHDSSLEFEPIYRILFEVEPFDVIESLKGFYGDLDSQGHGLEIYCGGHFEKISVSHPQFSLPVESLQVFLDEYVGRRGGKIDYIHGRAETLELAKGENTVGFVFDTMKKSELFSAIAKNGVLPRKAFSMGEACDKRFYIECRRIRC